jgi:hypothetical protein
LQNGFSSANLGFGTFNHDQKVILVVDPVVVVVSLLFGYSPADEGTNQAAARSTDAAAK